MLCKLNYTCNGVDMEYIKKALCLIK